MVDRISQLPDGVLASILSRLSMREAAATSVMSRRWKNLWTFITRLDFDASKTLYELDRRLCEMQKSKYTHWVNQVLDLHQSPIISMFKICFPLNQSSKSDIDRWLEIVMGKKMKVQRFELDLKQNLESSFQPSDCYAFPYEVLVSPRHFGFFKCLRYLCFKYVNVNEQVLEYFLSNCPLERFCVEYSPSTDLVNLTVTSPCLQLKYFEICCCWKLENIGIFAPNLVSFKYRGRSQINLPFNNLNNFPSLVEAYIGGMSYGFEGLFCGTVSYAFRQLSNYLVQLESLTLEANACEANLMFNGPLELTQLKQLTNLKRLVLIVRVNDYNNLLGFTSLIRASPSLHEFVLQLRWSESGIQIEMQREVRMAPRCPHKHLKVVELIGFVGHALDVELAEYLLEKAINLEKITINTCHPILIGTPFEFDESEERRAARDRAMELRTKLRQGAELFVL
uniref:F-box domain-containing protein n=2 Tax=Davidia involucrata TaxID=16924 RepID=A0A5B7A2E0_DAVIN